MRIGLQVGFDDSDSRGNIPEISGTILQHLYEAAA